MSTYNIYIHGGIRKILILSCRLEKFLISGVLNIMTLFSPEIQMFCWICLELADDIFK